VVHTVHTPVYVYFEPPISPVVSKLDLTHNLPLFLVVFV
jgi:hypothetical protein